MSGPSAVNEVPITDRSQLVEFKDDGAKQQRNRRIDTEHEKFG